MQNNTDVLLVDLVRRSVQINGAHIPLDVSKDAGPFRLISGCWNETIATVARISDAAADAGDDGTLLVHLPAHGLAIRLSLATNEVRLQVSQHFPFWNNWMIETG